MSVKSRREKVRDKKLRDIAAARSSKLGRSPSTTTVKGADQPTQAKAEGKSAPTTDAQTGPKLSTIMVVVDLKPDGETANNESSATKKNDAEPVVEMLPESGTKLPTPPTSTETSPLQKHGFDTRTSLTRRREWQTGREHERKKREANAIAKAQLRQLAAASGTPGSRAITDPECDSLQLYDAYREQRLRDIESRVRRLERSGDVWLRALIPMLEDVNKSSTSSRAVTPSRRQSIARDDESNPRDCASDDETTATSADRLGRAAQRRQLIRRASLSRERMLEELMRREALDNDNEEAQHLDVSGMGCIEPLMRELASGHAGERSTPPKVRFQTTSPRKVSENVPPIPLRLRPVSSGMRA